MASPQIASEDRKHLLQLDGGFAAWRWVALRGAGFPVDLVLPLAMPRTVAAVEVLDDAQARASAACEQAIALCKNARVDADDAERRALSDAIKRLSSGQRPRLVPEPGPLFAALEELARLVALASLASTEATSCFHSESKVTSDALRGLICQPRFREALTWQNPSALHTAIDAVLASPAHSTDAKTRRRETLAASYLQRYCTKNDTIGFFGPVGWGELSESGPAMRLQPGESLLSRRTVYFEHWAIDALAHTLAADPALRPWLAPRRMPTIDVQGLMVHVPDGRTVELPIEFARLLLVCDGDRTAREVAERVLADGSLNFEDEADVFSVLEDLAARGLILWTLEVPTVDPHPERLLRASLERITESGVRDPALAALDALVEARASVERAATSADPAAVEHAISSLGETFTRLTGAPAQRGDGGIYASRTVVYEDCIRDAKLELGPGFLERLDAPLSLLLRSARWFTFEIAERYRRLFDDTWARLRGASPEVPLLAFFEALTGQFADSSLAGPPPLVEAVAVELREKWTALFAIGAQEEHVVRSATALLPEVTRQFVAPHPGWPSARYHSPDLLIAARSVAAVVSGDFQIVLGELHVSANTPAAPSFLYQHPRAEDLIRAREQDLPNPAIAPLWPKSRGGQLAPLTSLSRHDLHLETGQTRSWRPRSQTVGVGELVVTQTNGTLCVRTRDGRKSFDVIDFFDQYLMSSSISHFHLQGAEGHAPRITIDGLVVARRRWVFPGEALHFAARERADERFIAARRWVREAGLPRFLFMKVPTEAKPLFLDTQSALSIEIVSRMIRQTPRVTLSEMLPAIDACWLADRDDRRYTSELRLALLDPEPWRPRQ